MTYGLTVADRLLTWLDVERILKQETQLWSRLPEGVHSVDCYHDAMDIAHSCSAENIQEWLQGLFGKALSTASGELELRLRAGNGTYPIRLESIAAATATAPLPLYPLWREIAYLSEVADAAAPAFTPPSPFSDGPQLVSFHSFKGGVGRTTALMTYVAARLQAAADGKSVKVLVVDADLEAPGVTFWLDEINCPQVSFVQFLEAMHYPPESEAASLDFFADELKKTSFNVEGSLRELFVLPAALALTEIQDMPVQPGHLSRNPDNPWILTDHLHALGKRLGVDTVFIDLRAGLSELASPIIFDPRVEHYFVTTVARQSVLGMSEVLQRLHVFNSLVPSSLAQVTKPSVIISLLTEDLRRLPCYTSTRERVDEAYPPAVMPQGEDVVVDEGVEWLEADFSESLMAISSVREALSMLKTSSLYINYAEEWGRSTGASDVVAAEYQNNKQNAALALFKACEKEFAEQSDTDEWLVTEPLRNLGRHFAKEIPNAVLVGAKGAGKTFTHLQICQSKTWDAYLNHVGEISPNPTVAQQRIIFPVLSSGNVEGSAKTAVAEAKTSGMQKLAFGGEGLLLSDIQRRIEANVESGEQHWDDFWSDLITSSLGCAGASLKSANLQLVEKNLSVVLVFDGIEEVFKKPNDHQESKAIESLLKLVNRLGELPNQAIGALTFVRIDYVQATIKQNLGQFLSRFRAFALTWNPESFLRLAYWLCARAEIIGATTSNASAFSVSDLIENLVKLWGVKLGKSDSKEGYSARWVFAALCDLTGRFQARDLVRFFQIAAEEETKTTNTAWSDRVLSPEAMRKAIPLCSRRKVEEAISEIEPLKAWSHRMEKNNISDRSIPFSAASVLLEQEELSVLRELGVVYEDVDPLLGDKRLFLPEIYRAGLKFDLSAGRPKIQALLKKNLGKMPF